MDKHTNDCTHGRQQAMKHWIHVLWRQPANNKGDVYINTIIALKGVSRSRDDGCTCHAVCLHNWRLQQMLQSYLGQEIPKAVLESTRRGNYSEHCCVRSSRLSRKLGALSVT